MNSKLIGFKTLKKDCEYRHYSYSEHTNICMNKNNIDKMSKKQRLCCQRLCPIWKKLRTPEQASALGWTKEKPTESGEYHWKAHEKSNTKICEVVIILCVSYVAFVCQVEAIELMNVDGWWHRITEPPFKEEENNGM